MSKYLDLLNQAKTEQKSNAQMGQSVQYWNDVIPTENENPASFGTRTKAALVDDPKTKLDIYARDRFPNNPAARERYGMFRGDPYYVEGSRKVYENPQGFWGGVSNFAADVVGKGPVEFGAVTGGILGSTAGPAGTIGGAGFGAAAGEGYRKMLANLIFDEPQSLAGNATAMTQEGALASGGAGLGHMGVKYGERKLARDIDRLDIDRTTDIARKADERGIYLTPAEQTNLASLKAQQKMVGNMTDTSDRMEDMYRTRAGQVEDAVETELRTISPVDSPEVAGDMARGASAKVYDDIIEQRAKDARPFYEDAATSDAFNVIPVLDDVDQLIRMQPEGGATAVKLAKVKKMLTRKNAEGGRDPVYEFDILDAAKKEIDDLEGAAIRAGNNNQARILGDVRRNLLKVMDEQEPSYAMARKIWSEGSNLIERIDGTLIKNIANLSDEKLQTEAIKLLNPATRSPESIKRVRGLIMMKDPDAWNAISRAFIQDAWEKAGRQFATTGENFNRGAKFGAMIFKDAKSERVLRAALSDKQFQSLSDLVEVLNATGRVKRVGSDTAWNQEMQGLFREEAEGIFPKLLSPRQSVMDWVTNMRIGKRANDIVDIISDPTSRATLRELKKMNPEDKRFIYGLSSLMPSPIAASSNSQTIEPPILQEQRR